MSNKSETAVSSQNRIAVLIAAIITGVSGFCMWRYYCGLGKYWIRFYATAIIYEIFWCLFFFLFWPYRKNIFRIPAFAGMTLLYAFFPQHFLYFFPLPQGQGSFRPTLGCWSFICFIFCSPWGAWAAAL